MGHKARQPNNYLSAIADAFDKVIVMRIVGDAEAYFFDWQQLSARQREAFVASHLTAFGARAKAINLHWHEKYVPFALLGHSMPPEVDIDLSAPHQGVLLVDSELGTIYHCSSNQDSRLAILFTDPKELVLSPVVVQHGPASAAVNFRYEVDSNDYGDFTLSQIDVLMHAWQVPGVQFV